MTWDYCPRSVRFFIAVSFMVEGENNLFIFTALVVDAIPLIGYLI